MKRLFCLSISLTLLLVACTSGVPSSSEKGILKLRDGTQEKTYSLADLQSLPVTEVTFNNITYKGVCLHTLLEAGGNNPDELKAVKVVASDGYGVNYDPKIFLREDVIVAYATAEGSLAAEDGQFRMVLPGEPGRLNVRMLTTIQVIK